MRLVTLWLVLIATSAGARDAGPPVRISGEVRDAFTRTPLAGATVAVAGHEATTDAEGRFALEVAPGLWDLETRAAGHSPFTRPLNTRTGEAQEFEILLIETGRFSEIVEVRARIESNPESPGLLPVAPAKVLAMAGGADNVFRVLQTLPGVAAAEEFGSRLSVRGGGPDQNLTVMDGVEIHNPYRLFGLVSAFNPETVDSFELTAGAFSARYGDRLSSLLVVTNRYGDGERRLGGSAALSVTDANLILEGALPGDAKGSWLVTGRRTYYDLVAERFVDDDLPSFNDLQLKATWEHHSRQSLSLFALRSRETTDAAFEGDRVGEEGAVLTEAKNDLVSLSFRAVLGERGYSRTTASFYENADGVDIDARFENESRRSNAPEDDAFRLSDVVFTRDLTVRDLSLRQELAYQVSPRHLLETGFALHRLRTSVGWVISGDRNESEPNGSSVRGGVGLPDLLDSSLNATRWGAWLQDRFEVTPRLVLEPGLRVDRSDVNQRMILSPRFLASLSIGDSTRLRTGLGRHTQSPGYEKLIQSDYFLDLTEAGLLGLGHEQSFHALLGLERDLPGGLTARVEGYYKSFDDLIVGRLETEEERLSRIARYDFPAELRDSIPTDAQITTFPVSGAKGRAYGFDVYLERRASSPRTRLTGWASYTYGIADRDAYGRRYPFEYDRRHSVSLVGNLRLGSKWTIGATARVASGFPRTPVLGLRVAAVEDPLDLDSEEPRLIPERDENGLLVYTTDLGGVSSINTARLPTFARLDLRATFQPRGPSGRWMFYIDLINVLDRENAGALEPTLVYDPDSDQPQLVEVRDRSIPFLPSFGIRFRF